MKTLIINGSPRKKGNTETLLSLLKAHLKGDIIEISAYRNNIHPCMDCRECWKSGKCVIDDDMRIVYNDNYDNIVLAAPVYVSGFPGPLVSLASRLQVYYTAKKFAKKEINVTPKRGIFILVGGGGSKPDYAIKLAKWIFKKLGATYDENYIILSLKTDQIDASQDIEAISKIKKVAQVLSKNE